MTIREYMHLPPPPALNNFSDVTAYARRLYDGLFRARQGKLECINEVTLTANAASTVLSDIRISTQSWIGWMPLTANAATELAAGTMYVLEANVGTGSITITHANNAQTDRKFRLIVIG